MENLAELPDLILTLMVSYPLTIASALFVPQAVFGPEPDPLTSPAGATFLISFMIWYVARNTALKIQYKPDIDLPEAPDKVFLVKVLIAVSAALSAQYLLLLIPKLVQSPPSDPVATVRALTYPISVATATYGLVYLAFLLLPLGSRTGRMTLMERFDRIFRRLRSEDGMQRVVAHENAETLALLSAMGTYLVVLYHYVHMALGAGIVRSGAVALGLAGGFACVFFTMVFLIGKRLDDVIEQLHGKQERLTTEDAEE